MAIDLPAPPGFHPPPPVTPRRTGLLVVALVLMVVAFVLPAAAVLVAPPGEHAFLEQLPDGSPVPVEPLSTGPLRGEREASSDRLGSGRPGGDRPAPR